MGIARRIERLERRAGLDDCPCRAPRVIELAEAEADDGARADVGGCESCRRPLPIRQIVAVRPEGARV